MADVMEKFAPDALVVAIADVRRGCPAISPLPPSQVIK
jgi:hypothetical protein